MKINKYIKRLSIVAVVCAMLLFCQSCTVRVSPIKPSAQDMVVVGTVGNQTVYYDEFRYALLNTKDEMIEKYGADIFTGADSSKYTEELLTKTYAAIENDYHAVAAMADFYYLGGSEALFSESAIEEVVKESINDTATECGSRAKYKKTLKENYMTDRLFRYFTTCEECANELVYVLRNDLGVIGDDEDSINEFMQSGNFVRTNHIFIEGISDENEALAESLRKQLSESTDILTDLVILKGKYCSDFTLTTIHGNYFAKYASDYGDEYEEIAFSTKIGAVGDVLKTSTGYYVIVRLPLESDWIEKKYSDFSDMIISSQFNIELEKFRAELKFTPNDYCSGIDILSVK